jgi:HPt (histidine-containing phosphotransfer) domain-containing protein
MTGDTGEAELLRGLRRDYLAESAERMAELQGDLARLRGGAADAAAALKGRLHRLAGSGGSYGFPEVSAIAREAELWLGGGPAPETIVAKMEAAVARLEAEFERARTAVNGKQ